MGESSLLLAEASVGKNAERVSHELGAREPSISTAPACVGSRSRDSSRTFLQSDDSQVLTSDVTRTDRWDPTVRHLLFLLQWRRVIASALISAALAKKRDLFLLHFTWLKR